MRIKENFFYNAKSGAGRAKVVSSDGVDVKYIFEGQLNTCTIGEFHQLFDLLSKSAE